MTLRSARRLGAAACFALAALAAAPASADGYPPFYGYSPYFGRPAPYFTAESDVQQVTTVAEFPVRTYYRGGPFYGYHETA
ncbi:MAG: hypothetical protein JO048_11025, partial [Methylobacteriaceae bacterium]|nr:hypothetical protein [Methylobacteriaceae bacterium]